jgi:hypothetical protein
VRVAVDNWNKRLVSMGSSFRLGRVTVAALTYADENFTAERALLRGTNRQREALHILPGDCNQFCGKILIVLSNRQCISLPAASYQKVTLWLVLKMGSLIHFQSRMLRATLSRMKLVMRSAFATTQILKCLCVDGLRPFSQMSFARFFPLADTDRQKLLELYPPNK